MRRLQSLVAPLAALALAALWATGCSVIRSDPAKATRQYPFWLKPGETIDAQAIADGDTMVIVNATPRTFENVDVWLNQRYLCHVDRIEAGENKRIPMGDFWDIRGEGPNPGGALRYFQPTPIRLVELQLDATQPLIGLQAVLTEVETR